MSAFMSLSVLVDLRKPPGAVVLRDAQLLDMFSKAIREKMELGVFI